MKKFLALLIFVLFIPQPLNAATEVRLVSTPHRLFDGTFRNDELAADLLPDGRLGKLIFSPVRGSRTWVIDPELIDEIVDMSDGYKVARKGEASGQDAAKKFISQFQSISQRDRIVALPYGNPDPSLTQRLAPSELRFYYSYGQIVLQGHLGRSVSAERGWSHGKSFASFPQRAEYTKNRQAISRLLRVVPETQLNPIRAKLALLLSPKLNKDDRKFFYYQAGLSVLETQKKLRISSGKYQLTSEKSKMPITLVNEFDAPITVHVQLIPMSYRVTVQNIADVTIEPKSRLQLSVPFTVLAPGPTTIIAQLADQKGVVVSIPAELAVNATIIDSRVAWFTTAAGILLLIAGITQSVRRVRKVRHEGS